jgi:predicted nucleotide-binding protein (sugar kinase/HSP70/actin superfamily)
MMATIDGPCRFGQYAPFLRKVLRETGFDDVEILSPRGQTGYNDFQEFNPNFLRTAWRALVCADILRKVLLQKRPYESIPGSADHTFRQSVEDLCESIEASCFDPACQMRSLKKSLSRARGRFRSITMRAERKRPLIGIVGEIFCRLNNFSNQELVRRLEAHGAECWMSDISEWISYSNMEDFRNLKLTGKTYSWDMLKSKIRKKVQHSDEHALRDTFSEEFRGYEEPSVEQVLEFAQPYLPFAGVEGEMVMSLGRSIYLARHGVDGMVDISPFTCMNGVVSEAIYPKLSRENGGIPIRNFYFDGQQSDIDRDIGIYMELARSYRERRQQPGGMKLPA